MIQQRIVNGNELAMDITRRLQKDDCLSYQEVLDYAFDLVRSNRESKGQVIQEFRQGIDNEIISCFVEHLIKRINEAEKENHFVPEVAYAKAQRIDVYSQCKSIGSSYEAYGQYGHSCLYFETERILPYQLCTLLDALLLSDENAFVKLVVKRESVLWPLRILGCIEWMSWENPKKINSIYRLAKQLYPYQCGVLMAQMWDFIYGDRETITQLDQVIRYVVQCIFQELDSPQALEILAYHLNRLVGNTSKSKQYTEKLICHMGKCIVKYNVTYEEIESLWFCKLKGRVNQEVKLLGLQLANEIEDILPDIALKLREKVLELYPKIWEKHEETSLELFFSTNDILNNIQALAYAMTEVKQNQDLITYLDEARGIQDIKELDQLVWGHQYSKFYYEIERTMMHVGITFECINILLEKQEQVEIKFAKDACLIALEILDRSVRKHSDDTCKQMIQSISSQLGKLINHYGEQFLEVVEQCIFKIYDVRIISYVLAHIQQVDWAQCLDKHMQNLLSVQSVELRSKELFEVAICLYHNGQYDYSLQLLKALNRKNISEIDYQQYELLEIYCYAFIGIQAKDREEQIANLKKSFDLLNRRYIGSIDRIYFKMQVVGWLIDRGESSQKTLKQTYDELGDMKRNLNSIVQKRLNQVVYINWEMATLVRIISDENIEEAVYELYDKEIDTLEKQLEGLDSKDIFSILIKLWRNKIQMEDDELEGYYQQWKTMLPQIPKVLQEYVMRRMGS